MRPGPGKSENFCRDVYNGKGKSLDGVFICGQRSVTVSNRSPPYAACKDDINRIYTFFFFSPLDFFNSNVLLMSIIYSNLYLPTAKKKNEKMLNIPDSLHSLLLQFFFVSVLFFLLTSKSDNFFYVCFMTSRRSLAWLMCTEREGDGARVESEQRISKRRLDHKYGVDSGRARGGTNNIQRIFLCFTELLYDSCFVLTHKIQSGREEMLLYGGISYGGLRRDEGMYISR